MNVFLKKNAENLLAGVKEGDEIVVTWWLNNAALGGSQEMGPITFRVIGISDRWIELRDVQYKTLIRLPVTAIRSVRHES